MNQGAPVAITGLGALCAAGRNLPQCMAALFKNARPPRPPGRFTTGHQVRYPVFEVPDNFLPARAEEKPGLTRTSLLALAAAGEAFADAGWTPDTLRGLRVGVCIGTTVGSTMNNEDFYREYRSGGCPDLLPIERFLHSNPASAVAREFGLHGPCQTVVNACSSGTDAVGVGAAWIRSGICDLVIAGGADELCRVTYNGFVSLMITDRAPCRPFDRDRRGLNLGEGAALLVLESEPSRRARKKKGPAFVLGYGSACDAYHLTAPRPDGEGLKRALTEALQGIGQTVDEIAFVNAHGTGTPDNDRVESRVLHEVLPGIPFLSTKGYTGHTLGAAGAIEAVFTVAGLVGGRIPATAGWSTPDPELPASPVRQATEVRGEIAVSQSLAFGGNNGVLVFGRDTQ